MQNYFANCKNETDVRLTFHSLAKVHHPDFGGNAETFKEISKQYSIVKNQKHFFVNSSQPNFANSRNGRENQDWADWYSSLSAEEKEKLSLINQFVLKGMNELLAYLMKRR